MFSLTVFCWDFARFPRSRQYVATFPISRLILLAYASLIYRTIGSLRFDCSSLDPYSDLLGPEVLARLLSPCHLFDMKNFSILIRFHIDG